MDRTLEPKLVESYGGAFQKGFRTPLLDVTGTAKDVHWKMANSIALGMPSC